MSAVSFTILKQLGGHRFLQMTGAKQFVGDTLSLAFTLPRGTTRNKCNRVVITLLPASDTYKVQFCSLYKTTIKTITTIVGVQAAELTEIFTQETGLLISL